jgi:hypothetical protein
MTDNSTETELAAELAKLMIADYSRENMRRMHAIMNGPDDDNFLNRSTEDIFDDVAGFAFSVFQTLFLRSVDFARDRAFAFKMLKKICLMAYSAGKLLEDCEGKPMYYIDHSSIGVLSRTIIETSIMFWYLSEDVSADEREFRFAVMNLHDTTSRVRLFKGLNPEEAEKQRANRDLCKKFLSELSLFQKRTEEDRERILGGQILYVNGMRSILRQMNYDADYYDGMYNYLSAQVHSHPVSYFRDKPEGDPLTYFYQSTFAGYALHHAWTFIVRVAVRAVETNGLANEMDAALLAQMTKLANRPVNAVKKLPPETG